MNIVKLSSKIKVELQRFEDITMNSLTFHVIVMVDKGKPNQPIFAFILLILWVRYMILLWRLLPSQS